MASLDERLRMRAAWETVRLAETITHAFENTEFYRELWTEQGVSPSLFVDRSSLELFPSIRKSDFSARPRRLISKVDPPDTIRDTSGTTGVRLPVYMNARL